MYGRIFGFQRLVCWPKWTPASRSDLSGRGNSARRLGTPWAVVSTISDWVIMRFLSVGPPPSPRISVAGAPSAESRGEESAAHRIRGLRWRACGVGRAESPKRDGGRTGGGYEGAAMYAPSEP